MRDKRDKRDREVERGKEIEIDKITVDKIR
jgi:hypothetical protein